MDEKCCYHCSSPEHFIRNCPLMKAARDKKQLNRKEGDGNGEGSLNPSKISQHCEKPPTGGSRGIESSSQTPFLNLDPFQQWYGMENVAKVKINGENYMALLDNGVQMNTITARFVKKHYQ